jgi:hypothetical protein
MYLTHTFALPYLVPYIRPYIPSWEQVHEFAVPSVIGILALVGFIQKAIENYREAKLKQKPSQEEGQWNA